MSRKLSNRMNRLLGPEPDLKIRYYTMLLITVINGLSVFCVIRIVRIVWKIFQTASG